MYVVVLVHYRHVANKLEIFLWKGMYGALFSSDEERRRVKAFPLRRFKDPSSNFYIFLHYCVSDGSDLDTTWVWELQWVTMISEKWKGIEKNLWQANLNLAALSQKRLQLFYLFVFEKSNTKHNIKEYSKLPKKVLNNISWYKI